MVTGAAGTMGLAAARVLLEEGARVALVDVDAARLRKCASELGEAALAVACDIADAAAVRRGHEEIEKWSGSASILVNNAGILSNHKLAETDEGEWRRVMSVNLDGAFFWAKAVVPGMRSRGWGRIVNVSSLAAKTGGLTAGTAYAASKGALVSLTFSLARELAGTGVTVNAIAPAYVKTPMITEQLDEAQRRRLLSQIPVGRFCEPEEFAHAVRFLVSPMAGFMTGEVLDLNGGLQMD